jgi:tetratricopeptide (TPR) repeat protein
MRYWIGLAGALLVVLAAPAANAGPREDCNQTKNVDRAIEACSALIRRNPRDAQSYAQRGLAYTGKEDFDRSITDYNEAIALKPGEAAFYLGRCAAYVNRGDAFGRESDFDLAIVDCDEGLRRGGSNAVLISIAYAQRGAAYAGKGDRDRAIADLDQAVRRNSREGTLYAMRAVAYGNNGDYDRSMRDIDDAIGRSPREARFHAFRGAVHALQGNFERAVTATDTAVNLNAKDHFVQSLAGFVQFLRSDYDRAIAGLTEAIRLKRDFAPAYASRGYAYHKQGNLERALADLNEALRLNPTDPLAHVYRGEVYEARGERNKAIEDYLRGLSLRAKGKWDADRVAEARPRLAALQAASPPPAPAANPPAPTSPAAAVAPPQAAALGRRVALVIGNARYRIGPLQNPVNDAAAVAGMLRDTLGFKVILRLDLGFEGFRAALRDFAHETAGAGLAMVYFAGHGTEVNGKNFLIPVDATLNRAGDLDLEAIALDTVIAQLAGATTLKLVILDACRNNPFPLAGAARGTSRGLSRVEPDENTLVMYAARDGTTADDGVGRSHSPFTEALLKHIATPGLEIQYLFREVRDDVLAATGRIQQPHVYGTLGRTKIYLRQ